MAIKGWSNHTYEGVHGGVYLAGRSKPEHWCWATHFAFTDFFDMLPYKDLRFAEEYLPKTVTHHVKAGTVVMVTYGTLNHIEFVPVKLQDKFPTARSRAQLIIDIFQFHHPELLGGGHDDDAGVPEEHRAMRSNTTYTFSGLVIRRYRDCGTAWDEEEAAMPEAIQRIVFTIYPIMKNRVKVDPLGRGERSHCFACDNYLESPWAAYG